MASRAIVQLIPTGLFTGRHINLAATYLTRFFGFAQFKRSSIPNGPKVGSGGSLSPRGDYRAPSDSEATAWLSQLEMIPDEVQTP